MRHSGSNESQIPPDQNRTHVFGINRKLCLLNGPRNLVGAAGFEPTTCSTQNCRATRLRYTPIILEKTSIHA
jgi:hypothetical protein